MRAGGAAAAWGGQRPGGLYLTDRAFWSAGVGNPNDLQFRSPAADRASGRAARSESMVPRKPERPESVHERTHASEEPALLAAGRKVGALGDAEASPRAR